MIDRNHDGKITRSELREAFAGTGGGYGRAATSARPTTTFTTLPSGTAYNTAGSTTLGFGSSTLAGNSSLGLGSTTITAGALGNSGFGVGGLSTGSAYGNSVITCGNSSAYQVVEPAVGTGATISYATSAPTYIGSTAPAYVMGGSLGVSAGGSLGAPLGS
eukprot:3686074-Amphidinium_carterae.1